MLTNYNGTAITYDGIGNPLNWRNATNIVWYGRQMSLFTHNNGLLTNYSYNSDGIRTGKQFVGVNGNITGMVKYTLDGNTIVAENRSGINIYYTYDDKGSIMGMIYGGENYIFSKNLQGDVIGIYNVDGQLVAKYKYNAFGEITAITDASGNNISTNASHIANVNPFRYRGYYYDTETGFYYLQSRYYDPEVGRFISADGYVSTGQGILGNNMFAYCGNNPVARIDPEGSFWWVIPIIIIPLVLLGGCDSPDEDAESVQPRKDLANAPDLDVDTAHPSTYNCYGNAIGKQINTDPTGYKKEIPLRMFLKL